MLSYLLFMFIHPCHFFNFISSCLSRSYIYVSYQFPKFNEGVSVQNLTWQSWGRLTRRNPESRMLVKNKKPDCPMPILTRCTCLNLHPPTTHPVPSSQALHDMTPVLHSRCAWYCPTPGNLLKLHHFIWKFGQYLGYLDIRWYWSMWNTDHMDSLEKLALQEKISICYICL